MSGPVRRIVILAGCVAIVAIFGVALPLTGQSIVDIPASGVTRSMSDIGGRPVVDVMVNGKGPFPMIVDTGASITVFSAALADELGVSNEASAGRITVDSIAVGEATVRHTPIARLGNVLGGLGPNPPRGVLSAEVFEGGILTFDFPARRLTITRGSLPPADGRRIFEYEASDPIPLVPVAVNGVEFRIHLDTGAPAGISLPMAAATTLGLEAAMVERGVAKLANGTFPRFEAPFSGRASLGDIPLSPEVLSFSDMRAGTAPGKGVIGMLMLRNLVVSVDAANRRVKFDVPRK